MFEHDPEFVTEDVIEKLVNALLDRPVLADACKAANISILAVRRRMRDDGEVRALLEEAEAAGNDILEARLYQRAMGEDTEVVLFQGRPVRRIDAEGNSVELKERKQSDRALLEMVKGRMREKYGDKSEVTHKGGTGVLMIPSIDGQQAFEDMLAKTRQEALKEDEDFDNDTDLDAAAG
jgi:hypothetical protein